MRKLMARQRHQSNHSQLTMKGKKKECQAEESPRADTLKVCIWKSVQLKELHSHRIGEEEIVLV